MASNALSRLKRSVSNSVGNALARTLPTSILARLAGIGEPPQMARSASMASIQGAMSTAEWGDTFLLFALYRDMILNSSHIQTELGKRMAVVVGQPESVQPADKSNADDVLAAKAIEDMISNCDNWNEGMYHMMEGHVWPLSVSEKIFEAVKTEDSNKYRVPVRYRLKELHPVNYTLLCYKVGYYAAGATGSGAYPGYGNSVPAQTINGYPKTSQINDANPALVWDANDWEPDLRFYSTWNNGMIDWNMGRVYKPEKDRHIIHRGNFLSSFRDNYGGALRGILFWWYLATCGRDWFSRFMERYGSPFIVGYANAQQKDTIDFLTKAFNQSTKSGALIVDERAKVELKEIMVSGAADGYSKFIALCNCEISKVILGQELSTVARGTGLGSGVADLQAQVRDDIRQADQRVLGASLKRQLFEPYLKINGLKGRAPGIVWGGASNVDASIISKTLLTLRQGGYAPVQSEHDVLGQKLGFKIEEVEIPNANPNQEPAGKVD